MRNIYITQLTSNFLSNIFAAMQMKVIVLLALCAMVAAYTDVDDSLNVENLIEDVPKLQENLMCFLNKGPCTEQNQGYKSKLTYANLWIKTSLRFIIRR